MRWQLVASWAAWKKSYLALDASSLVQQGSRPASAAAHLVYKSGQVPLPTWRGQSHSQQAHMRLTPDWGSPPKLSSNLLESECAHH